MNIQEKFDIMVARLFDGKGQCMNTNNICCYLSDKGNKCVVGVLIPDGHPAQKFDGGVPYLDIRYSNDPVIRDEVIGDDLDFLIHMQNIHDKIVYWDGYFLNDLGIAELKRVAELYGLELKM